jgi:hypothetical protein
MNAKSERCSPTDALNLLIPAFEPMKAADRLEHAVHEGARLYCDGQIVPARFRKRLMVVATGEPDGRWTADIVSAVGEAWDQPAYEDVTTKEIVEGVEVFGEIVFKEVVRTIMTKPPYRWEFEVDQVKVLLPQAELEKPWPTVSGNVNWTPLAILAPATPPPEPDPTPETESESEPPSEIDRIVEAPPRPRGGAPLKYQWHDINAEIARRCHDPKTGRVKLPKSERKLAKDMLDWCQTTYGEEPAESVMREAVRAMCARLRSLQK